MKRYPLCLLLTLMLRIAADAQEPRFIPFQGKLTDSSGHALPDGARLIQFQIFGDQVGGSPLWAGEVHRATVNAGLINVMLGAKNPLPVDRPDKPDRSFFDSTLYLQITVDADTSGVIDHADPPLLPRQALVPVLFATESANSRLLKGVGWEAVFDSGDPTSGSIPASKIKSHSLSADQLAQEVIDRLVPTGTVIAFAGTDVPSDWLECDGRILSVDRDPSLAALFSTIGTNFGRGLSPRTFKLPDLRGRTAIGEGIGPGLTQRTIGSFLGEESHRLSESELPSHSHSGVTEIANPKYYRTVGAANPGQSYETARNHQPAWAGGDYYDRNNQEFSNADHTHNVSLRDDPNAANRNQRHNTMQPSLVLKYIIKK